jgi:kynureninase
MWQWRWHPRAGGAGQFPGYAAALHHGAGLFTAGGSPGDFASAVTVTAGNVTAHASVRVRGTAVADGGPGCAGGLFLHRRHHGIRPGMAGWWGVPLERRFAMSAEHEPAAGAESLHIGTPSILATAPLDGALELFEVAGGVAPLRAKSIAQTSLIIEMADAIGIGVATPRDSSSRGGHVALIHPDAWRVCQALKVNGVVPDYRPPDIIRLAPSPLFTSFAEIVAAMRTLETILTSRTYEAFPSRVISVT